MYGDMIIEPVSLPKAYVNGVRSSLEAKSEKRICGVLKDNSIVIGYVADGFVVVPNKVTYDDKIIGFVVQMIIHASIGVRLLQCGWAPIGGAKRSATRH